MTKFRTCLITTMAAAGILVLATTSRGVTITDFVETENSLSFQFSGNGSGDFLLNSLPPLTHWTRGPESHFIDVNDYAFSVQLSHNPGGATVELDTGIVPYEAAGSDTDTAAHGTGLDLYVFSVTVNTDGNGNWSTFSGSFSAVHREIGVPDTGSTAAMASMAFLALAGARRLFRRAT